MRPKRCSRSRLHRKTDSWQGETTMKTFDSIEEALTYTVETVMPQNHVYIMVPVERSIYDYIVCDSATERAFVAALEYLEAVRLYLKLPNWFKVPTPIGNYNPDWVIVLEDRDQFGDTGGKPFMYLVRETKSKPVGPDLREAEQEKVHCGERHFKGALGVDFKGGDRT